MGGIITLALFYYDLQGDTTYKKSAPPQIEKVLNVEVERSILSCSKVIVCVDTITSQSNRLECVLPSENYGIRTHLQPVNRIPAVITIRLATSMKIDILSLGIFIGYFIAILLVRKKRDN